MRKISRQHAAGGRRQWPGACALAARLKWRGGFSFTEVMFAVIILGVGFIMVAGVFPVALQQANESGDQVNGVGGARAGMAFLGQVVNDGTVSTPFTVADAKLATNVLPSGTSALPAPSVVVQPWKATPPSGPYLWDMARGNLVRPDDSRYGWIFLYRRDGDPDKPDGWAQYAQVYIFPVHARNTATFNVEDDTNSPKDNTGTRVVGVLPRLTAKPVLVTIQHSGAVDLITVKPVVVNNLDYLAAVEGAYVVIQDDNITGASKGRHNGDIFHLGVHRFDQETSGTRVFELSPGGEFRDDPGADGDINIVADNVTGLTDAQAFIVGADYVSPYDATAPYSGNSMALGAYTTFVKIQPRKQQ
ncbi:MAG TPA: hypothetical protein VHD56_05215 [Tepidisphaeraceae bacterium]|nr:hypothetical protein [Tepidisphaeraceae bacterium]